MLSNWPNKDDKIVRVSALPLLGKGVGCCVPPHEQEGGGSAGSMGPHIMTGGHEGAEQPKAVRMP